MPGGPLTHEQALRRVCMICTNNLGKKAERGVSKEDERLIIKHVNHTVTKTGQDNVDSQGNYQTLQLLVALCTQFMDSHRKVCFWSKQDFSLLLNS